MAPKKSGAKAKADVLSGAKAKADVLKQKTNDRAPTARSRAATPPPPQAMDPAPGPGRVPSSYRAGGCQLWVYGGILVACALDAFCMLPHLESPPLPVMGTGDARRNVSGTSAPGGLPSSAVRELYLEEVSRWESRAAAYMRNLTEAERELGKGEGKPCRLAERAVRARHDARVKARCHGSALLHALLVLRDFCVYGPTARDFDARRMIERRREKMVKEGPDRDPTPEKVCLAVVEASARTSSAFTRAATGMKGAGYIGYYAEVVMLGFVLATATWAVTAGVSGVRHLCGPRIKHKHCP